MHFQKPNPKYICIECGQQTDLSELMNWASEHALCHDCSLWFYAEWLDSIYNYLVFTRGESAEATIFIEKLSDYFRLSHNRRLNREKCNAPPFPSLKAPSRTDVFDLPSSERSKLKAMQSAVEQMSAIFNAAEKKRNAI